jgi:hypothetical protein
VGIPVADRNWCTELLVGGALGFGDAEIAANQIGLHGCGLAGKLFGLIDVVGLVVAVVDGNTRGESSGVGVAPVERVCPSAATTETCEMLAG